MQKISISKAIIIGHLTVNLGVLFIIILVTVVGIAIAGVELLPWYLIAGSLLGWVWWSFSVPRWRRWAHQRVDDQERLQKYAVRTGLTWPKGSILEKTELKVKDAP